MSGDIHQTNRLADSAGRCVLSPAQLRTQRHQAGKHIDHFPRGGEAMRFRFRPADEFSNAAHDIIYPVI